MIIIQTDQIRKIWILDPQENPQGNADSYSKLAEISVL